MPTHESPRPIADLEAKYSAAWLRDVIQGRRPAFYSLRNAKDAYVKALGIDAAACWIMESAGLAGPWTAPKLPLVPLRDFANQHALAFEEWAPPREVIAPSIVRIGMPATPLEALTSRSFFLSILADATVFSKSNTIRVGDAALLDVQGDELTRMTLSLDVDAAVMAAGEGWVALLHRPKAPADIVDEALSLLGLHSFNFGHWTAEFLPKLWACLGRPGFEKVTLLVDEQMPIQHLESLRLFAGDSQPIRIIPPGGQVRVQRLWAVSAPVFFPVGRLPGAKQWPGLLAVDAQVFAGLLKKVEPYWLPLIQRGSAERVFLARSDSQHRRLLNRQAVEDWHRSRGFEIHNFYDRSFLDQLSVIRGASVVVGPEGSAFFTTFFASVGTALGNLTGPEIMHFELCSQVWEALEMPLRVVSGEEPAALPAGAYFNDYAIDEAKLPVLLNELEDAASHRRTQQ